MAGEQQRGGAVVPEVAEAFGVAGHGGMEDFTDLTLEHGVLVHQVAAMAAEQLDRQVVVGPGRFQQSEAVRGGAPEGGQVGVVGFVAGVGGLAVVLGGEGMDQARLEAGLAEGELHGPMVFAGAFDGDDQVGQVVLAHRLADAVDGGLQVATLVRQGRRFEQDAAVEIGEEVARAGLGTIDGEDAKVLGADRLDAGREQAVGLLQHEAFFGLGRGRGSQTRHGILLSGRGLLHPQPERQSGEGKRFFCSANPHTTV